MSLRHFTSLQVLGWVGGVLWWTMGTGEAIAQRPSAPQEAAIPADATRLSYVDDTAESKRSYSDTGFGVAFTRPSKGRYLVAVQMFASRYGMPQAPQEDFHVYVIGPDKKVIQDVPCPYGLIERGQERWYTIPIPHVEVPEDFLVAFNFNAQRTKGIYLGIDQDVKQTHSFTGLPQEGYQPVKEPIEWMVRAYVTDTPAAKGRAAKTRTGQIAPKNFRLEQQQLAQQRMRRDSTTYSMAQRREIETLYQVANEKWRTPEAKESLEVLVKKYGKANRTGCAVLYLGQMSKGEEQIAYLKQAIADFSDCYYGNGVQVGAYARLLLGQVYQEAGKTAEAKALFDEIRKSFPHAIDHKGEPIVPRLPE